MKRKLCACLCGVAILFNSCAWQSKPEDTINKLEKAFNNYDVEAVLECYEPSVQQVYAGIMEISGALLGGVDLMTLVNMGGGLANLYGEELFEGGLPKLSIDINSQEELSEDRVRMNVTMQYEFSEEMLEQLPESAYAPMTMDVELALIDGEWYICENAGQSLEDLLLNQGNTNETSAVPTETEETQNETIATEPSKKLLNIVEAREFHEGLAWVKSDTHWNIVDTSGNIINRFDDGCTIVTDFEGGYSIINPPTDGQWYEDVDSSYDVQIVNANGEVVLDFLEARYIGLKNYAGLEEGSIIVKKNVDEFEKSGDYFFHYDLNTGIEKEICAYKEESDKGYKEICDFDYMGNGFYIRSLWDGMNGTIYQSKEVLTFHNYISDEILSFRDAPSIVETLSENTEYKGWSVYRIDEKVICGVNGRIFFIDLNEKKCTPAILDYSIIDSPYIDTTIDFFVDINGSDRDYVDIGKGYFLCRWGDLIRIDYETCNHYFDFVENKYYHFEANCDYSCDIVDYKQNMFLVTTENANETVFYTIIDENMNPLFSPKRYKDTTTLLDDYLISDEDDGSVSIMQLSSMSTIANISDSIVIYVDETNECVWINNNRETTQRYNIKTGELLLSLEGAYSIESDFCDGYALVRSESSDSLKYMNLNGEILEIIDQS